MSLISVQRSPSPDDQEDGIKCVGAAGGGDEPVTAQSDSESTADESSQPARTAASSTTIGGGTGRGRPECYHAVKGAAVILSHSDHSAINSPRASSASASEIEVHLQSMLRILRSEHTLTMAVRLQCARPGHTRYLGVVVVVEPASETREAALLGFDFPDEGKVTIGVTVRLLSSSRVELDGDGGIRVRCSTTSSLHVFKPVSIQSMWSLFQCLHKELQIAVTQTSSKVPLFTGSLSHRWLHHYHRQHRTEDDSIAAHWHHSIIDDAYVGDLKASLKVDASMSAKSKERLDEEILIRGNLLQIMQSVDLDDVTSKDIRNRLEAQLGRDLSAHKEFIDSEMLLILGRLDKPSRIFDYLFLGTEWNASDWDELKCNNVGHILNVTKEVDCFFPAQFEYLKIWVSDEANTELLMHWQRTYDFIKEAKERGSGVLVHCKKGISRSSSTVIAYIMKEYGWSLEQSLRHVKDKRNCITPNTGFMQQLATFHGVLQASNNRHSAVFNITSNPSTASFASVCSSVAGSNGSSGGSSASCTTQKKLAVDERSAAEGRNDTGRDGEEGARKAGATPQLNKRDKNPLAESPTKDPLRAVVSAEPGKRRPSASAVVDTGKVKQHKSYFENRIVKGKSKGRGTQASSLVGTIAKSLGRLSLINSRFCADAEWKKSQQQHQPASRHSFTARRSHFDRLASGRGEDEEQRNVVRSLVNAFETKKGDD